MARHGLTVTDKTDLFEENERIKRYLVKLEKERDFLQREVDRVLALKAELEQRVAEQDALIDELLNASLDAVDENIAKAREAQPTFVRARDRAREQAQESETTDTQFVIEQGVLDY